MRVVCPHCTAAYKVDDRKIPLGGLTVRCPKCQKSFPVRPSPEAGGAVPLPATAPRPPDPSQTQTAGIPLPAPNPERVTQSQPLPSAAPSSAKPAFVAPDAETPFGEEDLGLNPPSAQSQPAAPEEAGEHPVSESRGFGEVEFTDPTAPIVTQATDLGDDVDPFSVPPPPDDPFSNLEKAAPPPLPRAPSAAPPPPSREATPSQGAPAFAPAFAPAPDPAAIPEESKQELENLFGEGVQQPRGGYRVRRRSGRIFGPFEEPAIVEMLEKSELLGNEDVAEVGSEEWKPIGQVKAFADAMRKMTSPTKEFARLQSPAPAARISSVFGGRMAAAEQITTPETPRGPGRKKLYLAVGAGAFILVLAVVVAAHFLTPDGFFGSALGGDPATAAAIVKRVRTSLSKGDYASTRAGFDLSLQAADKAPHSREALLLETMAIAALDAVDAATPGALERAKQAAQRLENDAKGDLEALAARLALAEPGANTAAQESALEYAASKRAPDPEVLVLLFRAAQKRGDTARAVALAQRLEDADPTSPRGPQARGLASEMKGDLTAAKAAFEKALAKSPQYPPSKLELAALAVQTKDPGAPEQLDALLSKEQDQKLAPSERARALSLKAQVLSRHALTAADAEATWGKAIEADPRLVEARVGLARLFLKRGEAAKAVSVLDPVAAGAPQNSSLAAVRIHALAAAGRALDATSLAEQALAVSPGDPVILLAKAAALERSGRLDEALVLYEDAAARAPSLFEPPLAIARMLLSRRDLGKASVEITAALEKGANEPQVHTAAGDVAFVGGDPVAAQAAYTKALELNSETAGAEVGLARLALLRGDAEAARAGVERALASEPRNGDALTLQGKLLWAKGDLERADQALSAAVEVQPRSAPALMMLGAVKFQKGDFDSAAARLTQASNEDPNIAEAHRWLGQALLAKNEITNGLTQLRRAVELDPKDAKNWLELGIGLERSGALEEAVEAYKSSAQDAPGNPQAPERLAQLYMTNNRCDLAAPVWEKVIAAAPDVSRHKLSLGDCMQKLGKHERAIKIYREVMRSDPSAVSVYYRLARAEDDANGAKAAFPWYEKAAVLDKENPMPHYYLAFAFKERGQRDRATQEFKTYLRLKPDADDRKDIEAEIEDLKGTP